MDELIKAATPAITPIIGVLVGYVISEFKEWSLRRRRRDALWQTIEAEIECCRDFADMYLKDEIMCPSYRLPSISYTSCLPILLSDGVLLKKDILVLTKFFNQVETLNRGLDHAHEARDRADRVRILSEYDRNRIKAKEISTDGEKYLAAREVLYKKNLSIWRCCFPHRQSGQ